MIRTILALQSIHAAIVAALTVPLVFVICGGNPFDVTSVSSPQDHTETALLITGALLCAIVAHRLIHYWLHAAFASAVSYAVLAQLVNYLTQGYLGALYPVAMLVSALLGFSVATLVALPFLLVRLRKS